MRIKHCNNKKPECKENKACQDLLNPRTGVSDCPNVAYLCNNPVYYTLMTQQCPRTCNRCPGTSTVSPTMTSRIWHIVWTLSTHKREFRTVRAGRICATTPSITPSCHSNARGHVVDVDMFNK
ncbi:shTK domain protein [Teladorsagia circumcincta]|uniref:ShTK domain protein n=1 Tax=Teladorsagia circumcincta TaxID=45464 RepID=A0A2G9U330_TELCI|nr:shTK domain protein [Teladorsagia circumcincta]